MTGSLRVVASSCLLAGACAIAGAARAQSPAPSANLSLTFVAPQGPPSRVTAVLLSGDGGWAELVSTLAGGLAAHGVAVVGINSRAWLSTAKTPDETATAVVSAIEASRARAPGDRLLLVGYSRGADMAPFVANRLPPSWRAELVGIAMLGLAPSANFEFHWSDLVKDTARPSDIPIGPELLRLRGVAMVCVYGAEEKASGCRDAPDGLMIKDERKGGHHFDGDAAALLQDVLRLIDAKAP